MTSGLRPTSSSRSIPNPALEAGIGAWLCHKEKAFVSETTSKSSRNQLSSHYGRCKMKFPEAGRGGQAQVHTGQEAGCLGIRTAQHRARWGLETGVWASGSPGAGSAGLQPSRSHLRTAAGSHLSGVSAYLPGPCLRLPPLPPPPPLHHPRVSPAVGVPLSSTSAASLPDRPHGAACSVR